MELAVSTISNNNLDQVRWLNNLKSILSDQYKQTRNTDDLKTTILKIELAILTTYKKYPNGAEQPNNLELALLD